MKIFLKLEHVFNNSLPQMFHFCFRLHAAVVVLVLYMFRFVEIRKRKASLHKNNFA
jgi:hypothetical protein